MADVELIATDLDRTFLGADRLPSALNARAVRQAAAAGVHVVFATGRPLRWLDVLEDFVGVKPSVLASNGAVSVDLASGRVLADETFPPGVLGPLVADLRDAVPGLRFCAEEAVGCVIEPGFDREPLDRGVRGVGPIEDVLGPGHRPVKVLARAFGVRSDLLLDRLTPVVAGRATATFSALLDDGMVELAPPGVSKGSALARLCTELGVDPAHTVAFGDMPNDLTMLDLVGRPYVVANAHPTVLARGYPVIGHHDDSAVGEAILALLAGRPVATVS